MDPKPRFFALIVSALVVGIVVAACTTNSGTDSSATDDQSSGENVSAEHTDLGFTDEEYEIADKAFANTGSGNFNISRIKDGVRVNIFGRQVLEVGESGLYSFILTNVSEQIRPEDPFKITFDSGNIVTNDPLALTDNVEFPSRAEVPPGFGALMIRRFKCETVGTGGFTFNLRGRSEFPDSGTRYSMVLDHPVECVTSADPTVEPWTSGETSVDAIEIGGKHVPVAVAPATSGSGCDELAWYPLALPVLAIEDGEVVIGEDGPVDPCGLGTVETTDLVEVGVSAKEWVSYCDSVSTTNHDVANVLFPSCDSTTSLFESAAMAGSDDAESSTPISSTSLWSGLQAQRNPTADTYNLGTKEDELPYWDVQFSISQPHAGCDVEHIHSDGTVYAFQNWSRGSSGWNTNSGLPVADPDLDGCGYGSENVLNGKPVAIEGQVFIEFCIKLEQEGINSNMRRQCGTKIDGITQ